MSGGDRVIRGGLVVSLTVVTAVAVVISYGHLWSLAKDNGEQGPAAAVLPITVDGLILATSLVIVNAARHRSRPPFLAWVMLLAGIGATLAGNIAHGLENGWSGSLVAGWPAVVAAGMFHLAIGEIRRGRGVPDLEDVDNVHVSKIDSAEPTEPWTGEEWGGWSQWENMPTIAPADRSPASPVQSSTTVLNREPGPDTATTDPEVEAAVATARERFADDLAAGRVPSIRKIRRQVGVGYPRAVQVLDALTNH